MQAEGFDPPQRDIRDGRRAIVNSCSLLTIDMSKEFGHVVAVASSSKNRRNLTDARPSEGTRTEVVRNSYYRRQTVLPLQNARQNAFLSSPMIFKGIGSRGDKIAGED